MLHLNYFHVHFDAYRYQYSDSFLLVSRGCDLQEPPPHREDLSYRRIYKEEIAMVVTSSWRTEFLQFLAALAI